MYAYIMKRTQIYLSDGEAGELRRRAAESGRTVSDLIREAIDHVYLRGQHRVATTLQDTRGAWGRGRPTGSAYVERLRPGRLAKLHSDGRK
jgi:hypothetical protein